MILTWICETCGEPIDDDEGYVHVNEETAHQAHVAHDDWIKRNTNSQGWTMFSGQELFNGPTPAHWQVHHRKCDPEPDSPDYWIGVERARSHAKLLSWTAHLMGKTWLEHTDWDELIRRMAGVDA